VHFRVNTGWSVSLVNKWIIEERTFDTKKVSSVARVTCGVPQGSILAPILFSLYMLPQGSMFGKCLDYLFIVMQMTTKSISLWNSACLFNWCTIMNVLLMYLNESKNEAIVFGPSVGKPKLNTDYDYLNSYIKPTVTNLGVFLINISSLTNI